MTMARDVTGGDIHALAGAYVLDAVTEVERAAFARHARDCEMCTLEVAELRETAGRMAEANWSVPSPRMRAAVLGEIARTRQVSPGRRVGGHQATGRRRDGQRHLRPTDGGPGRLWRRAAVTVAAALLVAGGGVVSWSVAQNRIDGERARAVAERQRADRISEVLAAPDARLHRNGRVSIVVAPSRDAGVAILTDLPNPGRNQAYQLWAIRGRTATSIGLLSPGQRTATMLVARMAGADTFGVSREPAGGSATPTLVVQTVPIT
jgi:anti-sigma-K factor RskA